MNPDESKIQSVDDYMATVPVLARTALSDLRKLINEIMPEASQVISYGIPTFKIGKRPVVYFAGYDKHVSLHPLPRSGAPELMNAIKPYVTGKGTIRFNLDKPLPMDLIRKVVEQMYVEAKPE